MTLIFHSVFYLLSFILIANCVPNEKPTISKRNYDSLHEYADADQGPHISTTTSANQPEEMIPQIDENNPLDISAIKPMPGVKYESEEILTAVYEATKQLPDKPPTKPAQRFASYFLDIPKGDGKKFSISDLFEKAGHNLASKLFGVKGEYRSASMPYAKRKVFSRQSSYPTEEYSPPSNPEYYQPPPAQYSPPPHTYDSHSQEGPHGYTVVYTKGEHASNPYKDYATPHYSTTPSYSSTPSYFPPPMYHATPVYHSTVYYPSSNYKDQDKKCSDEIRYKSMKRKKGGSKRKEGYGDESYPDYGAYDVGYGGGGGYGDHSSGGSELVSELKDKLKSLFMLVLPLVPVALILATLFPSSVFIPARSGTTFLPLNGTGGINIMQLTPGSQTNIPARRTNAKQEIRSAEFAKQLRDAEERAAPAIKRVIELAESSGILNGTMSELIKSLGPLFVKHAHNVLAMSSEEVLTPKMKALIMDKILRRVGQDFISSVNNHEKISRTNPVKIKNKSKKLVKKENSTLGEEIKSRAESGNNSSSLFDVIKNIPQMFGFDTSNIPLDGILKLFQIANHQPEMMTSMLGSALDLVLPPNEGSETLKQVAMSLLKQFTSDFKLQSGKSPKSRKRRSSKTNNENESFVLISLENSLRSILNGAKDRMDDGHAKGDSFAEKAVSTWNSVRDKLHHFISRGNDDPSCLQRIICQTAHLGRDDDASLPQRVMWKIVNRLLNVAPSQFGIRALMTNAKSGRCSQYKCPLSKLGSLFF